MKSLAVAILATAVIGCATPQHSRQFTEGRQYGQDQIEAAKTDVYTKFMRTWRAVHGWFIFQW